MHFCLHVPLRYPNGTSEVNHTTERVPPELPEPVIGINCARDGMNCSNWLSLVAVHIACWLLLGFFILEPGLAGRREGTICFLSCLFPNRVDCGTVVPASVV
ncbi:unnamed protein product [Ilex paraguariensis]|uniref:PHD finger protein ALFIN-LIKE n=1 Tax=Ilex paraguariensis TaxID=185542 RepID=A0ABC8R4K3_9AQUA